MILVSMPYCNSQDTLREAVTSLLKQSYDDYQLLIINDGDSPTPKEILQINHPRLKYFNLEKNHGRYFCDAVALTANPHKFFMPSDSDDLSNFNRLFFLSEKQKRSDADFTYSYQKVITRTGKTIRETYPLMQQPFRATMHHTAHWSGLYKTSSLKGIGGIHPNFRVGYDTLLVNLIRMKYKTTCTPRFLHTRKIRNGSLTQTLQTGFGSPHRLAATRKLMRLYHQCMSDPESIKKIIESSIDPQTLKEVKKEARRLKREMKW